MRKVNDLFLVISCLVWWTRKDIVCSKVETYQNITHSLLQRPAVVYKIPPQVDDSVESFSLTVNTTIYDVSDLDQINQLMTLVMSVDMEWCQKELSWNASEYNNMSAVLLNPSDIWIPRLYLLVGSKESLIINFDDSVLVRSDGTLKVQAYNYVTIRCEIHIQNYPFDTQICSFGISYYSLLNQDKKIEYKNKGINTVADYATSGEWMLVNVTSTIVNDSFSQSYPRYFITVKRKSIYYVIIVIFPMVLTSAMIPLVFLLPAKTGEKISYLVTIFTSTAIFLSYISNAMPKNLSAYPYLSVLLMEVLCEGLAAILATTWVVNQFDTLNMINEKKHGSKVQSAEDGAKGEKPGLDLITSKRPPQSRDGQKERLQRYLRIRRMDRSLFILFAAFQSIFLLLLIFASDWRE